MDENVECNENPAEEHARTIIHIDVDCFYAQVEIIRNDALKTVPLGIQQKNCLVTSNYIARQYGIKKLMSISEAKKLCPQLVLVNGEDLKHYRDFSTRVNELLRKFAPLVERLGLDENFIDVTHLVKERMQIGNFTPVGNIYRNSNENDELLPECYCGCHQRLAIGSQLADEMRKAIFTEIGLTTCAGISYNKVLAKLVGSTHKPNQQTILYPEHVDELYRTLKYVRAIPGVGHKTCEILASLNVKTISELYECSNDRLRLALGNDLASKILNLCCGRDSTSVKVSGKPLSISIEDSCKNVNSSEVENKFKQLLQRLVELVVKDGRIPTTLKITVRKFDSTQKISHREQKQCNISPSLFANKNLSENTQKKLLSLIMKLFYKIVNINKPFHVTLLGLSFTKFQEIKTKNNIASFLLKNDTNVSVQEITSLKNQVTDISSPSSSVSPMEIGPVNRSSSTDGSESEVEPSPKKTKFEKMLIARRRCLNIPLDTPSPSKLRVADLRLNSREFDRSPTVLEEEEEDDEILKCPPGIDESVFKELPSNLQQEIIDDWKQNKMNVSHSPPLQTSSSTAANVSKNKNSIRNYLIPNK